jgi:ribonuclease Z
MRVLFLGTGGYHPNARRHTACVMLPEIGLVFDAGSSFFRVADHLMGNEVDIILSHAHLDHVCGLTYFLLPMATGEVNTVRVHATAPTIDAVKTHLFAEQLFPLLPYFKFCELTADAPVSLPNEFKLTHTPLEHPSGSNGFRLDCGDRSMAYITDTTVDGTYTEFIRGVDLLIHECQFGDDMAEWAEKTGHSHTTPVAELARDAGVGRLVLVHIDPQKTEDDPIGIETARAIFPHTIVAEDLLEIDF